MRRQLAEGTRHKRASPRTPISQPSVSEGATGGWPLALEAKGSEKEDPVLMSGRGCAGDTEAKGWERLNPLGAQHGFGLACQSSPSPRKVPQV